MISIDAPKREVDKPKVAMVVGVCEEFQKEHPARVTLRQLSYNHGSVLGIPSAISWALESYEGVIVIEDDCMPHPSFFAFCVELLDRYKFDQRIMMISGNNFLPTEMAKKWPASYFFSRQTQTWGWATWRRAWKCYDHDLTMLDSKEYQLVANGMYWGSGIDRHWNKLAQKQKANANSTSWDSRWMTTMAAHAGLAIVPQVNLVRNFGFDADSLHTSRPYSCFIKPAKRMQMPLIHPQMMTPWLEADEWWFNYNISKNLYSRLRRFCLRTNPLNITDDE